MFQGTGASVYAWQSVVTVGILLRPKEWVRVRVVGLVAGVLELVVGIPG